MWAQLPNKQHVSLIVVSCLGFYSGITRKVAEQKGSFAFGHIWRNEMAGVGAKTRAYMLRVLLRRMHEGGREHDSGQVGNKGQ